MKRHEAGRDEAAGVSQACSSALMELDEDRPSQGKFIDRARPYANAPEAYRGRCARVDAVACGATSRASPSIRRKSPEAPLSNKPGRVDAQAVPRACSSSTSAARASSSVVQPSRSSRSHSLRISQREKVGDGRGDLPRAIRSSEQRLIVGADFAAAELLEDATPQRRPIDEPRRDADDFPRARSTSTQSSRRARWPGCGSP